jgi:hypothetical protein
VKVTFNQTKFNKEMNNILNYSVGFLNGVEKAKPVFIQNIGKLAIDMAKEFVDANARMNPQMLHHVYEWSQTGSPEARLFDLDYSASSGGLSFSYTFRQSLSVKQGSNTPFYNKAEIMESGVPVSIKPKKAKALAFNVDGEQVFTRGQVRVENPGGEYTQGSFEKTMELFLNQYFTQSFLKASGISADLNDLSEYKRGLRSSKTGGKSAGMAAGYKWLSTAGVK